MIRTYTSLKGSSIVVGLLLLTATVAPAADLGQCVDIEDATARLACYDTAAGRVSAPTRTADEFGMDDRLRRETQRDEPKSSAPESLSATISEAQRNSQGYFTLTLDNGQRWYVAETSPLLAFSPGDEVVIRRGSFGSYLLKRAKGGQVLRARRIG